MSEKSDEPSNFIEWLGFNSRPDYSRAKPLGVFLGFSLSAVALLLLVAAGITLFDFLKAATRTGPYSSDFDGSAIRNIGLVLAALLGAPFVVWRSVVAAKQAQIADEALFNDKIDAAAHGLTSRLEVTRTVENDGGPTVLREWADDLVTRSAAIDRLEGLVSERPDVAPRIVRLIATYVRGNFPKQNDEITEPPFRRRIPRLDLQRSIDAIGRLLEMAQRVDPGHWRLDLKGCDFDGVDFRGGFFRAVDFSGSRFEGSLFDYANLDGCILQNSLLNFASFVKTNMKGVRMDFCILNRPDSSSRGVLPSVNLGNLFGATFVGADISALDYLGGKNEIAQTFGTRDTNVSSRIRAKMPDEDLHDRASTLRELRGELSITEEEQECVSQLEATGFQRWSPYDSSDLATVHLLGKFFEELDMKRWPYWV